MGRCGSGLPGADAAHLGAELGTPTKPVLAIGRLLIYGIDGILRSRFGVKPFTNDPACILRISSERSQQELLLSDGTRVQRGDSLIGLHAWNERLRDRGSKDGPLAWGRFLLRGLTSSLRLLARDVATNTTLANAVALRAEFSFATDLQQASDIARRLGFDLVLLDQPGGRVWRKAFWDNFYAYGLMWAYSPQSLKGKRLSDLNRVQIWMSCSRLVELYGRNTGLQARCCNPSPRGEGRPPTSEKST